MSLKLTGELCVMTMKNDAKFEEDWTCQFKIVMRNLMNLTRTLENLKNLLFNWLLSPNYIMSELKNAEELCLMVLKIDVKLKKN